MLMRMFPIKVDVYGQKSPVALARQRGVPYLVVCVPWEMIDPHKQQAIRNHMQSLETLASRGGLSAAEAVAVLEDKAWGDAWRNLGMDAARANETLARLVAEWVERELYPSPAQRELSADPNVS